MVFSCVAANCTNKASLEHGISLHTIPYFNDERPEAKKRRKIWVDFIKAKRVFEPSKTSTLCSAHFKPEDFERRFHMLPGQTKPNFQKLKIDEIGICVFPTIHAAPKVSAFQGQSVALSARRRRMVMRNVQQAPDQSHQATTKQTPAAKRKLLPTPTNEGRKKRRQKLPAPEGSQTSDIEDVIAMADSDTSPSNNLERLAENNRRLKNQVLSLQVSAKEKRNKLRQMKRKVPSDPPKRVRFTSRSKNTLELSWQAPDTHSLNGKLKGYQICYSTKENDKYPQCSIITTTDTRFLYTIGNLKSSTRYFVTVAAGTTAGYGKKSGEINSKTIGVPSGSPNNVRFIYQKKNSLKLSWESPKAHLLNGALIGYQICYSTKENDKYPKCSIITTTDTRFSYTIGNLKSSTRYFVTVAAGTTAGYGKKSGKINSKTIGVPSGSPKNVRFIYRKKSSLRLTWESPEAHLLNGALKGYQICYSTKENDDENAKCSIIAASRYSFTIYNLKTSTKYFVTVAAGTSAGYGVNSAEISKTTFPNGEPVNLVANSYSSLKINVTKPANYIKEVMVVVQTATRKATPSKNIHTGNLKPYQENRRYRYYVAAYFAASVLPLTFVIGDGKGRDFGKYKYINHPLKQSTEYIVFLRFFENQDSFYSTDWSKSVRTMIKPPAPNISEPISTAPMTYQVSWSQSLPDQQTVLKYLVNCSFPGTSGEVSSLTEETKYIIVDYNKRYTFTIQVETEAGKSDKILKSWWTHSAPLVPEKTMNGYTVKLWKPFTEDQNITTVALVFLQLQSMSSIPHPPEVIKIEKSPVMDKKTNNVAFIAKEFNIADFTGDFIEISLLERRNNQRRKREAIKVYKLSLNATYRVAQMNSDESGKRIWSYWSEPFTNVKVELPPSVENIAAKPSNFSVHLSWTIPLEPYFSSNITHFIIYLDGKERHRISEEICENQFTLRQLKPSTEYTVGIRTQDISLQKSKIVKKIFKTKEAVPGGPPLNVVFLSRGINSLTVSWKAPDKSSWNGVLTGYQLCISTNDTAAQCYSLNSVKSNTFTVHGLKSSTKYFVAVAAGTSVGYGKKSLEISKITNGEPVSPVASYYSLHGRVCTQTS